MSNLIQERITILENKVKDTALSPLFAQLAAYYLEVGRAHDALRVCDAGLAHHPFYTTGHLIKGKALLALAMKSEAAREFEFVADFFPENPEITRLLTSLRTSAEISDQTPRELLAQQEQVVEAPITGKDIPSEWAGMLQDKQPQSTQQTFAQVPSFDYGEIPHADTVSIDTTQPGVRREPPPAFTFTGPTQESTPTQPELTTSFDEKLGFSSTAFEFTISEPQKQFTKEELTSFEKYAARMREELSGEGTLSLDNFFHTKEKEEVPQFISPTFSIPQIPTDETMSFFSTPTEEVFGSVDEPPVFNPPFASEVSGISGKEETTTIEDLAQKLQGVGRIAPIIDFTKKETTPISEQDSDASAGFVTPTLAEIYAKQGWYDDAIKAYRTLARTKPEEREKFEKRIQELEALKAQSSS